MIPVKDSEMQLAFNFSFDSYHPATLNILAIFIDKKCQNI